MSKNKVNYGLVLAFIDDVQILFCALANRSRSWKASFL